MRSCGIQEKTLSGIGLKPALHFTKDPPRFSELLEHMPALALRPPAWMRFRLPCDVVNPADEILRVRPRTDRLIAGVHIHRTRLRHYIEIVDRKLTLAADRA